MTRNNRVKLGRLYLARIYIFPPLHGLLEFQVLMVYFFHINFRCHRRPSDVIGEGCHYRLKTREILIQISDCLLNMEYTLCNAVHFKTCGTEWLQLDLHAPRRGVNVPMS